MRNFVFSIPVVFTLLLACSSGTGAPSGGGSSGLGGGSSGASGGSSGSMSSGGQVVGPPYVFPASCTATYNGCPIYVCECDDLSRSDWLNSIPGSSPNMCSVPTTACDARCSFSGMFPIKATAIRCITDEEFSSEYPAGRHPGEACNPEEGMNAQVPRICVFPDKATVSCPVQGSDVPGTPIPLNRVKTPCPPDTKICPTIAEMKVKLCKAP
jgi:hypothetical protein